MKNVAYTAAYRRYRQEQAAVFCAEYLLGEETTAIAPGYRLKKRFYQGAVGPYTLSATQNELLGERETVLYTWENLDNGGEFCQTIEHRDGKTYLVFREDLYGYSVLDLTTMRDFQFFPADSFPAGETFIWTAVCYQRENNLLAVSGCYWACPFGTLLVDFAHPMEAPGPWIDVQQHLEHGYDQFDDLDFVAWRGTDLVLRATRQQTGKAETIVLTERQYRAWMTGPSA